MSLATDFVCIDRLQGDALTARTVAVYADGRFEDDVEYALKDTPCGEVVGKTICRFDAGVRRLFPQDAVLQDLAAEGYAGTTLWSFEGKPIGLIALMSLPVLLQLLTHCIAPGERFPWAIAGSMAKKDLKIKTIFPGRDIFSNLA